MNENKLPVKRTIPSLKQDELSCQHIRIKYRTNAPDDYRIHKIATHEYQWCGLTFAVVKHENIKVLLNHQTGGFVFIDGSKSIKEMVNEAVRSVAPLLAKLRCQLSNIDFTPEILFFDKIRLFSNKNYHSNLSFKNSQSFSFGLLHLHQKIDEKGVWFSADLEGEEYIKEFRLNIFDKNSVFNYCKIIRLIQINYLESCDLDIKLQSDLKLTLKGDGIFLNGLSIKINGTIVDNIHALWVNEMMPSKLFKQMVLQEKSKPIPLRDRIF